MLITNNHKLPDTIVKAVSYNYKPKEGRYGVTDLIGSPYIRYLKMKHWDSLTEDASDKLWALLGQAIHAVLDKAKPENALSEEKLVVKFENIEIVGKVDLLQNEIVNDWKVVSVFAFLLGKKQEWIDQLNLYGWLYRKSDFKVSGLKIQAILRDWVKSKAVKDFNYPRIPFLTVDVPMWTDSQVESLIKVQLNRHLLIEPCTPLERWRKPTKYAVKVKGKLDKKAVRVLNTKEEAEKYIGELTNKFEIEHRKGEDTRCLLYCPVREVCDIKEEK